MHYLYFVFIILITSACNNYPKNVEQALQLAGKNRSELEKVLTYYGQKKEDSLKLKAAEFLISNMPFYYSLSGSDLNTFKSDFRQAINKGYIGKEALDYVLKNKTPNFQNLDVIKDIETVNADYLIKNIEHSFGVWKKQPWGKNISFNDFCNYILPYRIGDESLEDWKSTYYNHYQPYLDSVMKVNSTLDACQIIYRKIVEDKWSFILEMPGPHLGANHLFYERSGSCRDRCDLAIYVMRSLGIPVGTDMVLHSPDQANKHFWNFVLDNNGKSIEFTLWEEEPIPDLKTEIEKKRGKVYRKTFEIQDRNYKLRELDKKIPDAFKDLTLKDVSNEYFKANTITIKTDILGDDQTNLYYIAVFDIAGWYPIDWGIVSKHQLSLSNIEPGVMYALCKNINGRLIPVYYPFSINQNNKPDFYIPQEGKTQALHLERKFTMKFMQSHMNRFKGGIFEASNSKNFTNTTILYKIDSIQIPKYYTIQLPQCDKFRYIRYNSPDNSLCNMAELSFFNKEDQEIKGNIIGTEGAYNNETRLMKQAVFDNDPLTFFNADKITGVWVGLDLGKPKEICKIKFLPRNDDNFIKEGDSYELFYAGKNSWIPLGTKVADNSQVLIYENAPVNALFWLRNNSRGKEERIFTYKNNKQIWW
ncbi:MAG: hypothetical protein PHH72_12015 [Parabacteroides sp.]|nr:hypothetical protein [Parabacteroides sp.]MDD4404808.1 hypothetical protein [Parabacteroides sp.]